MRKSFSRILTLTGRNIKEILRDPLSLVFTLGFPLLLEVLFYLIFHKMTSQFEMKYLAPGIVVFSQSFLTLFVGILLATDRNTSFLTRLYVSRAKSFEFVLAYALAIVPIVAVQSVLFFLVGGILDASIFSVGIVYAILMSFITSLFFVATGILLGSIVNEKAVGGVASIVIAGQSILSGMWFPLDGLGKGVITFMNVLPFRNASQLVQHVMNGIEDAFYDFGLPLIIILAYTFVMFVLAVVVFRHKMKAK